MKTKQKKQPPKLIEYDGTNFLYSEADIKEYLQIAFKHDDPRHIALALGDAAKARSMLKISQDTGLNRGGLYRSLNKNGDPKLSTVAAVLRSLGFRLSLSPLD